MRAVIKPIGFGTIGAKQFREPVPDAGKSAFFEIPMRHPRLVGDDDQLKPGGPQSAQTASGIGIERDLGRVNVVRDVGNERAVFIPKNSFVHDLSGIGIEEVWWPVPRSQKPV